MPFVNFRKIFRFFSFDFRQNFNVQTFPRWLSIRGTKFFLRDIQKFSFQNLHFGPIRWFLDGFSNFRFFIGEICILIRDFWVIFKNYSMWMLSIRETILSHAEHTRNRFYRMLSILGTNFRACSASGKMWTLLHVQSMLSIRWTNFIAHWAYGELISSHAEHTWSRISQLNRIRFSKISCYRLLGP